MRPCLVYSKKILSGLILLLAFIWFSMGPSIISLQFPKSSAETAQVVPNKYKSDQDNSPIDNSSEEKTETENVLVSSEYLKEDPDHIDAFSVSLDHRSWHDPRISLSAYIEFVSPPPKSAIWPA